MHDKARYVYHPYLPQVPLMTKPQLMHLLANLPHLLLGPPPLEPAAAGSAAQQPHAAAAVRAVCAVLPPRTASALLHAVCVVLQHLEVPQQQVVRTGWPGAQSAAAGQVISSTVVAQHTQQRQGDAGTSASASAIAAATADSSAMAMTVDEAVVAVHSLERLGVLVLESMPWLGGMIGSSSDDGTSHAHIMYN